MTCNFTKNQFLQSLELYDKRTRSHVFLMDSTHLSGYLLQLCKFLEEAFSKESSQCVMEKQVFVSYVTSPKENK